jgi:hypothetical protein
MKCKDIRCEAYREYEANGKIKRRCVIFGKHVLLKESETLPLWCPRMQEPEIKRLLGLQNRNG